MHPSQLAPMAPKTFILRGFVPGALIGLRFVHSGQDGVQDITVLEQWDV
jgi:hypothetical protein